MNEEFKWQGRAVEVRARLVPRYLWNTASIDVLLDGECILRTGGQFKITGSYSTAFVQSGTSHTAELRWGSSGFSHSFPYELWIDGAPVCASTVRVQNWPMGILCSIVIAALLLIIIILIRHRF